MPQKQLILTYTYVDQQIDESTEAAVNQLPYMYVLGVIRK